MTPQSNKSSRQSSTVRSRAIVLLIGICVLGGSQDHATGDASDTSKSVNSFAQGSPANSAEPKAQGKSERARGTTKPVAATDPIQAAVKELLREYQDAKKNNISMPRTKPDYFVDKPEKPELLSVLRALSKPVVSDAEADAYVRLQLLSALPTKLEGEIGLESAKLMAVAPALVPMPGVSDKEKQELDRIASRVSVNDVSSALSQWQQHQDETEAKNLTSIKYRENLYARLPGSRARIDAGLEDVRQRVVAGIDVRKYFGEIGADVRAFAQTTDRPRELRSLSQSIRVMNDQLKTTIYDTLEYNEQQRRATWKRRDVRINEKSAKELIEFLDARSRGE